MSVCVCVWLNHFLMFYSIYMKYKTDLRDTGRRHRTKAVPKHYLKKLCPLDAAFGRSILFFESYLIYFFYLFRTFLPPRAIWNLFASNFRGF